LSIILAFLTFSFWKSGNQNGAYWVTPILAVALTISTAIEGVLLAKKDKWYKKIKDSDERTVLYGYKAGYITFIFNMILLGFALILFSSNINNLTFIKNFNPLDFMGITFLLNIFMFLIMQVLYILRK
jgi:hypothetical protein